MAFLALFLKKEYNKKTGSNFLHPLERATAFFVAHTSHTNLYASFSFSYENIVVLCPSFLLFSPTHM